MDKANKQLKGSLSTVKTLVSIILKTVDKSKNKNYFLCGSRTSFCLGQIWSMSSYLVLKCVIQINSLSLRLKSNILNNMSEAATKEETAIRLRSYYIYYLHITTE